MNYLPFVQSFEPLSLDGGVMHEYILAGFLGDEAKPFLVVEPLDFTTGHNLLLLLRGEKKDTHWPPPTCVLFSVQKNACASKLLVTPVLKTRGSPRSRISFSQPGSGKAVSTSAEKETRTTGFVRTTHE